MKKQYNKIVKSIAFVPAIISLLFLLSAVLMLFFDRSEIGKEIKSYTSWLSLKDASTARDITSTITTGMISLLVFSFSTVLIVLNQAATNMSNRLLSNLIENRFQQIVLGFYVGTIVYSLFLLSTIRDIDDGIYVPALSIYLLISLTVIDIFFFIYFLHFITQSVKYETIIRKLRLDTLESMERNYRETLPEIMTIEDDYIIITADESGYLQDADTTALVNFCVEKDCVIQLLIPIGGFILKNNPFLKLQSSNIIPKEDIQDLLFFFDFFTGHPINSNPINGFRRLREVAITSYARLRDPGTTELCLHTIADLLEYRMHNKPTYVYKDEEGITRVSICNITFGELLTDSLLPVFLELLKTNTS